MTKGFVKLYDHEQSNSLAANLREKRFTLFKSLLTSIPGRLKILDVGGSDMFWKQAGLLEEARDIKITLINVNSRQVKVVHPNLKGMVGDARDMKQFDDKEFDVVFSNSVIEHVGDYNDQLQMAKEVMRVGKRYFIQTPNLYFPVESHFVFPFFQFLPLELRIWLLTHFDLGWFKKTPDQQRARKLVSSIRLLSKKEVVTFFPKANLTEEKLFGLTKSFILYDGWDTTKGDGQARYRCGTGGDASTLLEERKI